jgi:alpha-glucosidase (family GH31 glycosyl hydrolase)
MTLNYIIFLDWFAMNATSYWYSELLSFYDLFEYDGLWIDMNEVSNFCNRGDGAGQVCILDPENSCETNECCLLCSTPDELNAFDFPPFVPHCVMGALGSKTIPMSVVHSGNIAEYNAHNLHVRNERINKLLSFLIDNIICLIDRSN